MTCTWAGRSDRFERHLHVFNDPDEQPQQPAAHRKRRADDGTQAPSAKTRRITRSMLAAQVTASGHQEDNFDHEGEQEERDDREQQAEAEEEEEEETEEREEEEATEEEEEEEEEEEGEEGDGYDGDDEH